MASAFPANRAKMGQSASCGWNEAVQNLAPDLLSLVHAVAAWLVGNVYASMTRRQGRDNPWPHAAIIGAAGGEMT